METPQLFAALIGGLVAMGGVLVAVIKMLLTQLASRDKANSEFQARVLAQIEEERKEDRVLQARIVDVQDKILERLTALESKMKETA